MKYIKNLMIVIGLISLSSWIVNASMKEELDSWKVEKIWVWMTYYIDTKSLLINNIKYQYSVEKFGHIRYDKETGRNNYYFLWDYFPIYQYDIIVDKNWYTYLKKANRSYGKGKQYSLTEKKNLIKTVDSDPMLGSQNIMIWGILFKFNAKILDINYNSETWNIYIIKHWFFGTEVWIEKVTLNFNNPIFSEAKFLKDEIKSAKESNMNKSFSDKNYILARAKLSKIKNGKKYIEKIDTLLEKNKSKLPIIQKNIKTVLNKKLSNKNRIIIEYMYQKIWYLEKMN